MFEESSDSDSDKDGPNNLPKLKKMQPSNIGPSIMGQQIAKNLYEKALAEDPTIFQYDELYDDMNSKREESTKVKKLEPKTPKYIKKLLETAEKRKIENELRIERQVQKEREAEGEQFKDKEAFVTSTYRKKLEEMRQLREQHERDDYLESIGDATKQKDGLDSFYRHLYEQKLGDTKKATSEEKNLSITEELQYVPIKSGKTINKKVYRKRQLSEDDENSGNSTDNDTIQQRMKGQHLPNNIDADSDFSIDVSTTESETETEIDISILKKKVSNKESNFVNSTAAVNSSLQMLPNTVALQFGSLVKETELSDSIKTTDEKISSINESKCKDNHQDDKGNLNEEEKNVDASIKPKRNKDDIWRKKTVGQVFEDAVQRYQERKANRQSYGKD